jgi:N-acyl-D-aspartate/D-glutamate deacylase
MHRLLAAVLSVLTLAAGRPAVGAGPDAVREAVARGLALVQKAAGNYPTHRNCFSCHHQTLPMLAMAAARDRGLPTDAGLLQDQAEFTLASFRDKLDSVREGRGVGGGAMTVGYALWALDLAGHPADETTEALTAFLLKTQKPDGYWSTGRRPPMEESAVTTTVLAALGLQRYFSVAQRRAVAEAVAKVRDWLRTAPVTVQEDRASRLWGLVRLGADAADVADARAAMLAAQRDDGGWASAEGLQSDAYATGQALARLSEAGLAPDHPAFRRGLGYLMSTRRDDGSWKVETRSRPIQVYFDNGDPHGVHQFISTPATCWAVVALAAALAPAVQANAQEPVDVLIRGGKVVDGTGNPWFLGDVAIRGDRIVAVGRLPEGLPARRVIDAKGLVVAPGFIDMHSHSDTPLLEDGAAMSKITQGVTTDVLGEGSSGGPSKGKRAPASFRRGGKDLEWTTLGGYFDALEQSGIAINAVSYAGLGTLLGCVMGDSLARPTTSQREEVAALLDEAMSDGAFGLSTMLMSPREFNVTTDDIVALGAVVRRHGGIYSTHNRNEGSDVLAAVDEAIAIGEGAGIPVDIIHLKIAEQALWRRMDEIVARFNDARRRGVNVQANVYPYTRGNNDLVSIIPPWAHEGGKRALLARLADPAQRARIKSEILSGLPGWYNHYTAVGGDWSRMLISARLSPANARFQGWTMDAILAEREKARGPSATKADPLDLFLDFLAEENGSVSTIYAHHTEADMNLALVQPWCSIGSDGSALAVEGPLRRGHPHPRNFGTFPRVLGVYVRQRHLLTLEDAVRKMTSLNAAKLGITDRGLLRPGQFADVTVFDPETVIDRATYLEPFQYSEGVVHVLVNGRLAFENGKPTPARAGRVIRHGKPERSETRRD